MVSPAARPAASSCVQGADAGCTHLHGEPEASTARFSTFITPHWSDASQITYRMRIKDLSLTFIWPALQLWMCALDILSKKKKTRLVCKRVSDHPPKRQTIHRDKKKKILNGAVPASWNGLFFFFFLLFFSLLFLFYIISTHTKKWHLRQIPQIFWSRTALLLQWRLCGFLSSSSSFFSGLFVFFLSFLRLRSRVRWARLDQLARKRGGKKKAPRRKKKELSVALRCSPRSPLAWSETILSSLSLAQHPVTHTRCVCVCVWVCFSMCVCLCVCALRQSRFKAPRTSPSESRLLRHKARPPPRSPTPSTLLFLLLLLLP